MVYRNWKCYAYHIYGDNSRKEWSYQELKEYFEIDGTEYAICKKELFGNPDKGEYYNFYVGDCISIDQTFNGFQIRITK